MFFAHECIFNFSRISKSFVLSRNVSCLLISKRLCEKPYTCKKKCFSSSAVRLKEVPPTLSKYELFSEETAPVILDVEEERQKIISSDKVIDEMEGIELKRGITGVFDIEQLVDILRKEKAEDIFVVKVPDEYNYVNYMVIVSGRSFRHMLAMSAFIRKIYKKKVNGVGHIPMLEGKKSNKWMALDLGNIALHVFSKEYRKVYDLETLWAVGKEYDIQEKDTSNEMFDYAKILASLSPNT